MFDSKDPCSLVRLHGPQPCPSLQGLEPFLQVPTRELWCRAEQPALLLPIKLPRPVSGLFGTGPQLWLPWPPHFAKNFHSPEAQTADGQDPRL